MVVIELLIFFVYIYYPMQQLPQKLTRLMINLMNDDVKLLKRKGVDNLNTLEEMNNQPIAKLQRKVSDGKKIYIFSLKPFSKNESTILNLKIQKSNK